LAITASSSAKLSFNPGIAALFQQIQYFADSLGKLRGFARAKILNLAQILTLGGFLRRVADFCACYFS